MNRRPRRFAVTSTILLGVIAVALPFVHGAFFRHSAPPQTTVTLPPPVPDPRPLTTAEQQGFVPLVCGGSTPATGQYQYNCATVPGYPDTASVSADDSLSLTSVTYGGITAAGADEAYVSYQASFEPHATNFGGGVLFKRSGAGWMLLAWVPGGQIDGCLSLGAAGPAKFVCNNGYEGQGELDSTLDVVSVTPPGPAMPAGVTLTHVLKASDLRQTNDPNDQCTLRKSPDQAVLLGIDSLRRAPAPDFAVASITYVTAADATAACAKNDFADAPTRAGVVHMALSGAGLTLRPSLDFAPADF